MDNAKRRMKIVFVCTGNTCRSPMAEVVFKKLLAEKLGCQIQELPDKGFDILSGGLAAYNGMTASPNASVVVQKLGVSLEDHQSRYVDLELIEHSDAVLVMTKNHLDMFQDRFHDQRIPVQMLSFSGSDISDPFGGDEKVYTQCLSEIEENLKHLVFKILS
ncbi:MAG: low molecular weight protein arginine phosphatase [Planctomycetes bacterium]|nr:low molecular weight protein arginine phosphatase [Planctomycetota bacterium]NBY02245.1 low molecular weight protein arginine phosphatase [Planctomycetota bacterium]